MQTRSPFECLLRVLCLCGLIFRRTSALSLTKDFRSVRLWLPSTVPMTDPQPRILYCHCQYAQVVPREVKDAVLRKLCESGAAFEAVADLCEMSARRDPALQRLAAEGSVKIAACFPRAVKWLFHQAGAPLPITAAEVLNMRVQSADEVATAILSPELNPNLPAGKVTAKDAPAAANAPLPKPENADTLPA